MDNPVTRSQSAERARLMARASSKETGPGALVTCAPAHGAIKRNCTASSASDAAPTPREVLATNLSQRGEC
jgi:hypothetical protein